MLLVTPVSKCLLWKRCITQHMAALLWLIRTIKVTRHVTQHHPGPRTPRTSRRCTVTAAAHCTCSANAVLSVAPSNVDHIDSWINHKVLSQQTRDGAVGPDGGYTGQRTSLCAHPLTWRWRTFKSLVQNPSTNMLLMMLIPKCTV